MGHVQELTAEPLALDGAPPALARPAALAEGPLWHGGERVSWVDILAGRVVAGRFDGARLGVEAVHEVGAHVGAAVPLADGGGWLLAAAQGFARLGADGAVEQLAQPERPLHGDAVRMNDAKADPAGRLWAGTMAYDAQPGAGTLWRVGLDGRVRAARARMTVANGLGWSPDGATMYHVDSKPRIVWTCPFDAETGEPGPWRALIEDFPPGCVPDGLCVDAEGCLWVALWGGGALQRHAPDGRLLARVRVSAKQPSSCCLAGPDGRTLLITSATQRLERPGPGDGRLHACPVDVPGPPATPFRGALPRAA